MDIKSFIIGLVVFIVALVTCTTFAINMYGEDGYDIDLSNDSSTALLQSYKNNASAYQDELRGQTGTLYSGLPGEGNSSFLPKNAIGSDAQLQLGALSAVSNIKGMMGLFSAMLVSVFNMLGMDVSTTEAYLWFFGALIIVPLTLILLSAVLRNPVF